MSEPTSPTSDHLGHDDDQRADTATEPGPGATGVVSPLQAAVNAAVMRGGRVESRSGPTVVIRHAAWTPPQWLVAIVLLGVVGLFIVHVLVGLAAVVVMFVVGAVLKRTGPRWTLTESPGGAVTRTRS